jgi:hypothetical protein
MFSFPYPFKKVKQSHYMPWHALRVPGEWGSQMCNRVGTWRRLRSALRIGRLYPHELFLVPISVRGRVDPKTVVRPEELCQWKCPVAPPRIDPAAFRFVAQCLKHYAITCPQWYYNIILYCGTTVVYVVRRRQKCRYAAHDYILPLLNL